jgi:hypothetical protein
VLTSWRLLACSIAAVTAMASVGASASPIHRCQQHRPCKALEARLGDIDSANSAQFGWRYVHHSPGRWLFFGPGYVFEPGKGILDGPCGLPSSACSDMVN